MKPSLSNSLRTSTPLSVTKFSTNCKLLKIYHVIYVISKDTLRLIWFYEFPWTELMVEDGYASALCACALSAANMANKTLRVPLDDQYVTMCLNHHEEKVVSAGAF